MKYSIGGLFCSVILKRVLGNESGVSFVLGT